MTTRSHTVLITILALAGLALLGIGRQEVQPWDEALIASRAQSIVLFDTWADQASHATGGIVTAARPPMEGWVLVPTLSAMGPSSLAIRMPGIILLALSLAALYQLGKRALSFEGTMTALCLAAASPAFFGAGRMATSAMPFAVGLLWFLVAVSAVLRGESPLRWLVVGSIAAAIALLSSTTVAAVVVAAVLAWVIAGAAARGRTVFAILGMVVVGLCLAAPWYVMMAAAYGEQFIRAATMPHNPYGRTGFDLPGMLLLGTAGLPVLASYAVAVVRNRGVFVDRSAMSVTLALAVVLVAMLTGLVAPSFLADVVPVVAALLSIPIVYAMERMRRMVGRRHLMLTVALLVIGALFLVIGTLAPWIASAIPPVYGYLIIAFMIVVMVVPLILPNRIVDHLAVRAWKPVLYGTVAIGIAAGMGQGWFGGATTVRGAREVGARLLDAEVPSFVLLYHDVPQASANDPSLAWYTGGWMNGWRPGRTYGAVRIPSATADEQGFNLVQAYGMQGKSVYIVHAHGGVPSVAYGYVGDALAGTYEAVPIPRSDYTLYRRILR